MSSILLKDENYNVTQIRNGLGVSGYNTFSSVGNSDSQWTRLMPSGNDGALVSGEEKQLDLQTIRDDVLDATGWNLYILNAGNFREHIITNVNGSVVTLENAVNQNLPAAAVEYVLFPDVIVPFSITSMNAFIVDVGLTTEDVLNPTGIKKIGMIPTASDSNAKQIVLPMNAIDKIFFKKNSGSAMNVSLSWGEHYFHEG